MMRISEKPERTARLAALLAALALGVAGAAGSAQAGAIELPPIGPFELGIGTQLDHEFGSAGQGDFATVETFTGNSFDGIRVEITLGEGLLPDGELSAFYFNLGGEGDAPLNIMPLDGGAQYSLFDGSQGRFLGGASFDWGVDFGGTSAKTASFIISSPDRRLSLFELFETQSTVLENGPVAVNFALRVEEIRYEDNVNPGVTVGGALVPEPATAMLMVLGLGGLAFEGRRRAIDD